MLQAERRHRPVLELPISSLRDGEHPSSFQVPASELGLEEGFIGEVSISVEIRKVASQITLRGLIEATNESQCDRCLAEIETDLAVPLRLFYREESHERSHEDEEGEEFRSLESDQDSIVLDDEVRQALTLALPLKHLCQDDCKGICAGCGADLNVEECRCTVAEVDPRWEQLASLLMSGDANPADEQTDSDGNDDASGSSGTKRDREASGSGEAS